MAMIALPSDDFTVWHRDGAVLILAGDGRLELTTAAAARLGQALVPSSSVPQPSATVTQHSRWTVEDVASLRRLYNEGLPRSTIAARLHRSQPAIAHRIAKLGLTNRRRDIAEKMRDRAAARREVAE